MWRYAHPRAKLSRHEEALLDTEASLALAPSSYKALRTRARINLHLEKYDSAIADFKASIQQAEFDEMMNDVKSMKVELKKAEADLKRSKTKDYYKILGKSRLIVRLHSGEAEHVADSGSGHL